jgi:GBP family porin
MKKSLLALAVLGAFAGAASAQSSVTLYGLVDIGFSRLDPKASGAPSTTAMVSGVQSGSRVGLRGSEDLGGGLRAIFNLEHGLSVDDGTQGQGRMWGRWAYAGFAGGFGELRLGRQWAAGFELFGAVDPWATGFNDAGSQSVFASANAIRVNNAIVYRTPVVGGFAGVLGYSLNPLGQEVAGGSDANNRTITAGARFGAGPFLGVLTMERVAVAGPDQQHLQAGATFDFKVAKLHAMYGQEKNQTILGPRLFGVAGANNKANSLMAGVTVPVGSLSLIASYATRDFKNSALNDGRVVAGGFTYAMSRRTNFYGVYSDADQKNVTGASDRKELALGIRHSF